VLTAAPVMPAGSEQQHAHIRMETELGAITMTLDLARAPRAGAYFLKYVDRGRYDGATIYRAGSLDGEAAPQLVQGGLLQGSLTGTGQVNLAELGIATLPEFETTGQTGLQHDYAAVSLARDLLSTGDAIPEFVIYLRRGPQADENGATRPDHRGYPVIGQVVTGMDVVRAVTRLERNGATTIAFLKGQILTEPVRIHRALRIPCAAVEAHAPHMERATPH
jgi:peptidyl-prolyl cis-trans isomerase A (cyclophilin A)